MSQKNKRKENVSLVLEACKEIGVELEPKEAQQIVNILVRFGIRFIKKMVKPNSVRDLLQDYLKFLEPKGKYEGAHQEIHDLTAERQKDEVRSRKANEPSRLTFSGGKR